MPQLKPSELITAADAGVTLDDTAIVVVDQSDFVFNTSLGELIDLLDSYILTDINTLVDSSAATLQTNIDALVAQLASKADDPHTHTKDQVGLSNVENLSPADMPISDATQSALDLKLNIADYVVPTTALSLLIADTADW